MKRLLLMVLALAITSGLLGVYITSLLAPKVKPIDDTTTPQLDIQHIQQADAEILQMMDELIKSLTEREQGLSRYSGLSERTGLPEGWLACIAKEARANEYDPSESLGRIELESGFDPNLISLNKDDEDKVVSADIGLMQINSKTAPWLWSVVMDTPYEATLEVAEGVFIDERLFDPVVNIRMGSWYYGFLLRQYKGDKDKANTAYNRGEYGLKLWISNRGTARSPYSAKVMGLSNKWAEIDGI